MLHKIKFQNNIYNMSLSKRTQKQKNKKIKEQKKNKKTTTE